MEDYRFLSVIGKLRRRSDYCHRVAIFFEDKLYVVTASESERGLVFVVDDYYMSAWQHWLGVARPVCISY